MDFSPLYISLKVAIVSTIITSILGIIVAYFVSKLKKNKGFFDALFTLTMILPPTVTGFFLLMFFGRTSVIGQMLEKINIRFVFTWQGAVLAGIAVSFPLMYRTVRSSFEQIDPNIISVAKTLGLSDIKIFFKIIIPLSIQGIIAGIILSFARALGEFGATMMFAGNIKGKTQTISIKIYSAMQGGDLKSVYFWVFVMMFISISSIVLIDKVSRIKIIHKNKG